jgi:phosphotransferase system HPr-like phosphotransfer protein
MSGYQFRVLAKNNTGQSTPSNVVTLTVNPILSVFSTHPSNVTVNNGQEALFSFAASNAVSYKAQVNTGSGWVDYAQNVTSPMSVLAATAKNGHQFRFVATSVDNQQATSNAATLTVSTPQVIQPFSFVKFVWGAITNAISIVVGNGTDDVGAYSYGNFGIKYNAPTTSLDFTYDSAASANVGPTTFNALVITGGASTLSID